MRPALAYRQRRLLDLKDADLARIDIQHGGNAFSLAQDKAVWKLIAPVPAEVDAGKVRSLTGALAHLEAVEFVSDSPKPDELGKVFGLEKPALQATIHVGGEAKTQRILAIGSQRAGSKDEFYARLDKGPVFVVRKNLVDDLGRDSLAYRSNKVWDLNPADITAIEISKDALAYRLERKDKNTPWKIVAPFPADPVSANVETLVKDLAQPKATFVGFIKPNDPKNSLGAYGLDKPSVSVMVQAKGTKHLFQLGKGSFGRVADAESVFKIDLQLLDQLNGTVFDLLDKNLLTLDPRTIQSIRVEGPASFTLEHKKDSWQIIGSPAPPFAPMEGVVQDYLQPWTQLQARRIVAYGPKVDWASFGLDKPSTTITVTIQSGVKHTLAIGREIGGPSSVPGVNCLLGGHYVRFDQGPAVFVLGINVVREMSRTHLDFVDPLVLKFDRDTMVGMSRQMPGGDCEIAKKGDDWVLAISRNDKPADAVIMGNILDATFRLRGQRVAGYPAKDLALFGLDQPAATVTIKLLDGTGKESSHVIKLGKKENEVFAVVDKSDTVVVLAPDLAKTLLAPAINFADHNLTRLSGVDQVTLQRDGRRVVFARNPTGWSMVDPVKADAESDDLEKLVQDLSQLRADELLADLKDSTPQGEVLRTLRVWGLEKPVVQCILGKEGKEVLSLAVGEAEPLAAHPKPFLVPKERRFAKLADKDLVFLLGPALSARIQQEFRDRKPWVTFDTAQVGSIRFEGPEKSFTLLVSPNDKANWMVRDKFERQG